MGTTGDGKTIDTPAINKTIEAVARAGGSTVVFPAGVYLSYSIHLKSNVSLYLEPGATILAGGTCPSRHCDAPEPNPAAHHYEDYRHRYSRNALLWGVGLENIPILDPRLIYRNGLTRGPGQLEQYIWFQGRQKTVRGPFVDAYCHAHSPNIKGWDDF